jgi:hypothetical protein
MDSLTFFTIAFIVGMGGTLLSLVFLSLLIWLVNKLFPGLEDEEAPHD